MKTENYSITNKETYLAARADWRAKYKELSATIREYKLALRIEQSARGSSSERFNCTHEEALARLAAATTKATEAVGVSANTHPLYVRCYLTNLAKELLAQREEMKEAARANYAREIAVRSN